MSLIPACPASAARVKDLPDRRNGVDGGVVGDTWQSPMLVDQDEREKGALPVEQAREHRDDGSGGVGEVFAAFGRFGEALGDALFPGFDDAGIVDLEVAGHDVRPLDGEMAGDLDSGNGFEAQLHAGENAAGRADAVEHRRVQRDRRRGLGQAVAFEDADAELLHVDAACSRQDVVVWNTAGGTCQRQ